MKDQILRIAEVNQLPIVQRHRFEPRIGRFDEDFGLVACRSQDLLDAEHLVSDRIAVAEGREHLVNADHARCPCAACGGPGGLVEMPAGMPASTWRAGGRLGWRRSNHPGRGSSVLTAGSCLRRSSM